MSIIFGVLPIAIKTRLRFFISRRFAQKNSQSSADNGNEEMEG